MSRTSIIALLIFGAILGYFLSFGAGHDAEISGERLSIARAVFDDRLGVQKANHVGADRIEIARRTGEGERDAAGRQSTVARDELRRCATSNTK